jgi:acyl carrier protein
MAYGDETLTYSDETLRLVRDAVGRVKGAPLDDLDPGADLKLDSINRITLIAEIENTIEVEIDIGEIKPEVFATLGSLSAFVEKLKA